MRFDTPIYFQRIKSEYDAKTGNYEDSVLSEVKRLASVTSTGVQTLNIVYGGIKQGSLTIRLQNHYSEPFDRIRIGEKYYRVDMARPLRMKHTLIVSEVQ
jgi:hypothetical protein